MRPTRGPLRGLVAALAVLLAGCSSTLPIHDQPIPFTTARQQATRDYYALHYGERPEEISIVPRIIVLHWTAIDTFDGSFAAFAPEDLPGSRPDLANAGRVNVSIQFLVDRDGAVYRLMPETWMARHVIGINHAAIGVENVGGSKGVDDLTAAQRRANIRLVRYLVETYPTIDYLIGHHEYRAFEGHPLWLERDPDYRTEKSDPGDRFMAAIHTAVSDLRLKGVAEIRREAEPPAPQ